VRCEDCIRLSPRARGRATRAQVARGAAAASAVAAAGGILLGWLGWVNLVSALVLGFVIGSAALLASRRHRDPAIQAIAGVAALGAILLAAVIFSLAAAPAGEVTRVIINISYQQFLLPALAAIVGALLRFLV
jgi:hypothetical protein